MTATFQPGCQSYANVLACSPGGVAIRGHADCESDDCGTANERVVEQHPNSAYWGVTYLFECGALINDGFEFNQETRAGRRDTFEGHWDDALPEGTKPIIDPQLVWMVGVTLPDGTQLLRDR